MAYIDAIQRGDDILVWVRDDNGKLERFDVPAPYYCFEKDANGTYKTLFGDRARKVEFNTQEEYNAFVRSRDDLFESDISPIYKFLSDTFYGVPDAPWNVALIDIETEVDLSLGIGYPMPENPYGVINSVSLFDVTNNEYHMIVLPYKHDEKIQKLKLTDDESKVNVHICYTERQLLDTFIRLIDDIDVLSGWNTEHYDIPYIVQRCIKVYGETEGKKKLCRDGFSIREREAEDNFGNPYIKYTLVGRVHIDYLQLYRKFTFGERTSYSLDNIAEFELGIKKLPYPGDLGTLYRKDPQTFYEYSLHDTRLLKLLDQKLKFLDLAKTMARKATIFYNDVFGSIRYIEHAIRNYSHFDRGEVLVLPDQKLVDRERFEGAFVLETKVGVYSWVSSIDINSLYPSVMRAINISPEAHVFQLANNHEDFLSVIQREERDVVLVSVRDGERFVLPAYEVDDMIREQGFTISAYGSIFKKEQGLIPEVLSLWYTERKQLQKKSREYFAAGDIKNGEYYDMLQTLLKLSLNSTYGAISNVYCRFFSIELAASVTHSGQIVERYQMWKADQLVEGMRADIGK